MAFLSFGGKTRAAHSLRKATYCIDLHSNVDSISQSILGGLKQESTLLCTGVWPVKAIDSEICNDSYKGISSQSSVDHFSREGAVMLRKCTKPCKAPKKTR